MLGPYMTRDFRHGSAAAQHAFDAAWEYLDDVAATFRSVARDIDVQVRVGHAAPVITRLARERNVHLIAMATHGRTGLARVVLGSTAIGTLHRTDVPLLLIRPGTLRQGGSVEHPAAA
jgi:nucleotide-binding universal stress UspA family protein